MGFEQFQIYLDKPHANYSPGQLVTGRVVVVLDSPKKYQGIKLTMKGKAKTHWTSEKSQVINGHRRIRTITHTGRHEYFRATFYLLGTQSGEAIKLPPGTHAYPFKYILPLNLPSSFASDYGYIRYSAKAVLHRPWNFDKKSKIAFKVASQLDLNQYPIASAAVSIEESKTFGCLWCASMPLTVNVLLPVRGYVPGQNIPVKVNVENQSGVVVETVQIVLQQIVKYTVTSPDSETKVIKTKVAEVNTGPVGGNETTSYERSLNVPPVHNTSLRNRSIIDIDYKLKFEAYVSGIFRMNLKGNTTVFIGTIPLRNYRIPQSPARRVDYGTITEELPAKIIIRKSMPTPSAPKEPPNCSPTSSNLAPPSYEKAVYGTAS